MKNILLSLIILILLASTGYIVATNKNKGTTSLPSPTPSPRIQTAVTPSGSVVTSAVNYCHPQALQALVTFSPGAGNIYGTFTLKNVSRTPCQILGNAFITAAYDTSMVKNITISHIGQTQPQSFLLAPRQNLYSQVHYPNGPQCQSIGLNSTTVTFVYKISPEDTITFKNPQDGSQQVVQTCKSPTDMTDIQIWNIATAPITP